MTYRVFRNTLGQVDAINRIEDGATVPTWEPEHPITLEFQEWLTEHPGFDMSDHEPEPEPVQPNWNQFRAQVLSHGAYFRIISSSPQNLVLNSTLIWALGEVGSNAQMMGDVANIWGAIAYNAAPTEKEIACLNAIAQACAMPFRLNEQGFMVMA